MKEILYKLVSYASRIHQKILAINDSYEYNLSDKELHFIIIGLLGIALVIICYPIFNCLAKKGHTLTLTWIYVFTLMIVLTFAIEIGQKITGTGVMEFADIMFGLVGFIIMYIIFVILIGAVKLIKKLLKGNKRNS